MKKSPQRWKFPGFLVYGDVGALNGHIKTLNGQRHVKCLTCSCVLAISCDDVRDGGALRGSGYSERCATSVRGHDHVIEPFGFGEHDLRDLVSEEHTEIEHNLHHDRLETTNLHSRKQPWSVT